MKVQHVYSERQVVPMDQDTLRDFVSMPHSERRQYDQTGSSSST